MLICRVAPNFGFGKSEIRPFFPNSAKFGFDQISGRIWPNLTDANATAMRSVKTNEASFLTFQVMYLQFSLFLHVNYSILINIIKLLKPLIDLVRTVPEANFVFFYLVCVKVGMAHVEFRKVRNLRK